MNITMRLLGSAGAAILLVGSVGCGRSSSDRLQGYVEGEFVYVASPLAGELETLSVERGAWVKAGAPLFSLECGAETAAKKQAERKLAEGKASFEDAKKGKRPEEIDAAMAQLQQAQAALVLSEKELKRQDDLFRRGVSTASDFDKARSARDQDRQHVSQMGADLETAKLGSRSDQVVAAEENVKALEAALARADWDLSQKRQDAPLEGLIFDTLYQQGEWVPAGRPAVVLLPPPNVKVRTFVPQSRLGAIHSGDRVQVFVDGAAQPVIGKVSFISPQAEFTPPVIYSQESRGKLVFRVEAVFAPADAAKLHPGQPVDVDFH